MPRRDGTGPMGTGSNRGGRGLGNCAVPGAVLGQQDNAGQGLGQAGAGRGWRRMFRACAMLGAVRFGAAASAQDSGSTGENQVLVKQNQALQSELDTIKKRLDEMETRPAGSR